MYSQPLMLTYFNDMAILGGSVTTKSWPLLNTADGQKHTVMSLLKVSCSLSSAKKCFGASIPYTATRNFTLAPEYINISHCDKSCNITKSDLYYKTITWYCNKTGNSWTPLAATSRVQIETQGCRYLYQLWQSDHIPLLCAVGWAFPFQRLVITVDTAAKMAPLTTATKVVERPKQEEWRWKKGYSEWKAEEPENLGLGPMLACSVCRLRV